MSKQYLAALMRETAAAHHLFEQTLDKPDADWASWYAEQMLQQMQNDFGTADFNPLARS